MSSSIASATLPFEEALKEGGYTVEQYIEKWKEINKSWDPNEVVVVYEFKVVKPAETERLNGFLRGWF